MAKLDQNLLERYHDGELSPSQAREVERQLAESPEQKTALEKTARLGQLLRMMSEESVGEVSFEGFAERVRAGVAEQQKPGILEQLRVRASEFFAYRRPIWIPAAVVACAAAAILALPLLTARPAAGPEPPIVLYEARGGSEIESVIFNDANGAKYNVKNDQGETVGVVWIVDAPEEEKDSAP